MDASRILTSARDGKVKIWDADSGKCLESVRIDRYLVNSAVFSRDDGSILASCNQTAKLWKIEDVECSQTFIGHRDSVNSAVFFDDAADEGDSLESAGTNLATKLGLMRLQSRSLSSGRRGFSPADPRFYIR
eukprot:TRINITY_DN8476_c0_g1_i1.p1 TRINITY_DN8476_c0_g1~~TRINITY_DN8476_c0_g1_i1.p1  ORF type:complete len:132 (+),score=24.78 TRINITY_DN8476_c0_g1_i1:1-396(+)